MSACRDYGARLAGEQHERAGLRLLVPGADGVDRRRVAHQNRMQPVSEQPLGERGVAVARAHEVGERAHHGVAELAPVFQERLGCGGEPDVLALELRERVAARRQLRQGFLRLASDGASARLLLLQLRHAAPRSFQLVRRLHRRSRLGRSALRQGARLRRRRLLGRFPSGPLVCGVPQQRPQLGPLPLQRRALPLERPELLDATQQAFFQLAHRGALRQQALPHLLLARAPTRQLGLNGRRVALGRLALGPRGWALPLRLPNAISKSSSSRRTRVSAIPKRSSIILPYRSALPRCRASERTCVCTSPIRSSRRARSAVVSSSRRSVLFLRSRYRPMPAASSNSARRSSAFSESSASIIRASMTTAASAPRPVPRSRSCTSRRRTAERFRRYSLPPERDRRRVTTTSW